MDSLAGHSRAALEKLGFTKLTEVQEKSIEKAREGKDFWARSPAFMIPIIENAAKDPHYKAIVLEPSRELVIQAANEARKLAYGTAVRVVAVYGGTPPEKQEQLVKDGSQIVVGTAERVAEILERQVLEAVQVRALVLDEADRLLTHQFERFVRLIAAKVSKRQAMLFSVHASDTLLQKARFVLKADFEIVKAGNVAQSRISHYYSIAKHGLGLKLAQLLEKEPASERAIVFCATIEDVEETAGMLRQNKIFPIVLHSKVLARARNAAVRRFRQEGGVLVTTDLAARGMHFDAIVRVYSLGVPPTPEFYMHRAGRTGRMGASGKCISIVPAEDEKKLKDLFAANGISAQPILKD